VTFDERVSLIRPGVDRRGGTWADLGSGEGAFTLALASLLGPGALVHAVDRDRRALQSLEQEATAWLLRQADGAPRIVCTRADFTRELALPRLDGALVANALHFQADACAVLAHIRGWLEPGAVLIVVEYDVSRGNPWVPYPLPWSGLPRAAACAGFGPPRLLGTLPSAYHRSMYAAVCAAP